MSILESIDEKIKELKVTALDISFNELADMYQENELIITPDYQRTFRWDIGKQSRFIETLLLEMPIPPIYAIEIDDHKYELIDGLQRISTYLSYRGLLKQIPEELVSQTVQNTEEDDADQYEEEEIYDAKNGFRLTGCDIIPDLNGKKYDELPGALKIKAKRSFVRMEILRKGINPEMKYHMFKRLNTGGEKLSYQELRNCSIRIIDSTFIDFINRLSKDEMFLKTIQNVSRKQREKKFAEELVLRFFAFKNDQGSFSHDIDKFLTGYMEKIALADSKGQTKFNYSNEEEIFKSTFKWLFLSMGNRAFSVYKNGSSKLTGFNVYQFEAFTIGIQDYLKNLENGEMTAERLAEIITAAKSDDVLISATVGGGKNSPGVFETRLNRVRCLLGEGL